MMKKIVGYFIFSICILCSCNKSNTAKAVARKNPMLHLAHLTADWYPQDKMAIDAELNAYFDVAKKFFPVVADADKIQALVVPHAGWYYSGLCAATAYQTLLKTSAEGTVNKNTNITRVIVLSPSHTTFLKGCALPDYGRYQTGLGVIDVDAEAIEILRKCPTCNGDQRAHQQEHAIEIQLPFLQKTIEKFNLVPLIIGHVNDEDIADLLKYLGQIVDDHTLIVVSSDFVHHGESYEYVRFSDHILSGIRSIDSMAVNALVTQSYRDFEHMLDETGATICGQNALKILLGLINTNAIKGVNARLTCYYTSSQMGRARTGQSIVVNKLFQDVPDNEMRTSVSYVGMVFTKQSYASLEKKDVLTGYEKRALLALARASIDSKFSYNNPVLNERFLSPIASYGMYQPVGAFVTLNTKKGELRGCIGNIVSDDPLFKTVIHMAQAAAFNDTRFSPVIKNELDNLVIDISILTYPQHVNNYREIKLGKHGIILNKIVDDHVVATAVFLPQVPTSYRWDLETTLGHLSEKAGLTWGAWREDCSFDVFEGYEIKEDGY